MKGEFPEIELIQNREIVTAVFSEMSSLGQLLICHGSDDVEAVIVGFLVLDQKRTSLGVMRAVCKNTRPLSRNHVRNDRRLRPICETRR
jgi:hypothetical protein